jgi:hypothetical protein
LVSGISGVSGASGVGSVGAIGSVGATGGVGWPRICLAGVVRRAFGIRGCIKIRYLMELPAADGGVDHEQQQRQSKTMHRGLRECRRLSALFFTYSRGAPVPFMRSDPFHLRQRAASSRRCRTPTLSKEGYGFTCSAAQVGSGTPPTTSTHHQIGPVTPSERAGVDAEF